MPRNNLRFAILPAAFSMLGLSSTAESASSTERPITPKDVSMKSTTCAGGGGLRSPYSSRSLHCFYSAKQSRAGKI
jgi:hypothetical protein